MGYDCIELGNIPKKGKTLTKRDIRQFIRNEVSNSFKVKAESAFNGVERDEFYFAVQSKRGAETPTRGVVVIAVKEENSLCYKMMSEEEGPFYHHPSAEVIGMLNPTASKEAINWRKKSMENLGLI